jgi:hypothetical protein
MLFAFVNENQKKQKPVGGAAALRFRSPDGYYLI